MTRENWWAKILSGVFHPMILPTLGIIILFSLPGYITFSLPIQARRLITGLVFINTCLAPLIVILLFKRTGIISDVMLRERGERIYPTLVSIFFYAFTYYLFRQANLPSILIYFVIGSVLLITIGLIVTLYWKISYHLMSMGGFLGFLIAISMHLQVELHLYVISGIVVAGGLGSARIKLNAHTPSQVFVGFLTGIAVMLGVYVYLRY